MASTFLDTVTRLITSPPAQIAAGVVLAGFVWKFFERVDNLLTDTAKLEIAVWLLDVKVAKKVQALPDTFVEAFERVFGSKHFTLNCFGRCTLASLIATSLMWGATLVLNLRSRNSHISLNPFQNRYDVLSVLTANILPDYIAYLLTRTSLRLMIRKPYLSLWVALTGLEVLAIFYLSSIAFTFAFFFYGFSDPSYRVNEFLADIWQHAILRPFNPVRTLLGARDLFYVFPAFFTTLWLWLYAASALILRAARRFDLAFQWFTRKLDIEEKPFSAIGFVAGGLVTVLWWAFVLVQKVFRI